MNKAMKERTNKQKNEQTYKGMNKDINEH